MNSTEYTKGLGDGFGGIKSTTSSLLDPKESTDSATAGKWGSRIPNPMLTTARVFEFRRFNFDKFVRISRRPPLSLKELQSFDFPDD